MRNQTETSNQNGCREGTHQIGDPNCSHVTNNAHHWTINMLTVATTWELSLISSWWEGRGTYIGPSSRDNHMVISLGRPEAAKWGPWRHCRKRKSHLRFFTRQLLFLFFRFRMMEQMSFFFFFFSLILYYVHNYKKSLLLLLLKKFKFLILKLKREDIVFFF